MSVNPGWGGQEFIPNSLVKLQRMRAALPEEVALEVDGGVHEATARACVQAGANLLVTGSGVFGADDPAAAYAAIAGARPASRPEIGSRRGGRRAPAGRHSTAVAPK